MNEANVIVSRLDLSTALTAIRWIDPNTLLYGMGGMVSVMRRLEKCGDWKMILKSEVFPSQSIHGLVLQKLHKLAAFGGKDFAVLELSNSYSVIVVKRRWRCEDWILDCNWVNPESIALLTAHGKLVLANICSDLVVKLAVSPDRSILYSARIVEVGSNEAVLLSGTVHNQVYVWGSQDFSSDGLPVATLCGHKGVIFSVRYDSSSSRICSTSDDRTARIWKVKLSDKSVDTVVERWLNAEISLVLTLFGHKARVWDSCFLPNNFLATIGEDGGCMVWSERGECLVQSWVPGGLLCFDYTSIPFSDGAIDNGRALSECHNSLDSSNLLLAAGGIDGSLRLFPLSLPPPSLKSVDLSEGVSRQICLVGSCGEMEVIHKESGNLILRTSNGDLLPFFTDESLDSYCVLAVSSCHLYLAAASIQGNLYLFSVKQNEIVFEKKFSLCEGRIFSVHWLKNSEQLLASGPGGKMLLVQRSSGSSSVIVSLELPPSKERWTTCAALIGEDNIVCGDRHGSLHLFHLKTLSSSGTVIAMQSLKRLHGVKGVCSLVEEKDNYIISVGRDGTMKKLKLMDGCLHPLLTLRLPMDWPSHIVFSSTFGCLIVGFHSVNLCVWSIVEERLLLNLKMWGGHRSWDMFLDNSSNSLKVVFLKDNLLHSLTAPFSDISLPSPMVGLHEKTINACDWWNEYGLIVTGGEDTCIKVCTIQGLRCLFTVRSHVSSIRALRLYSPTVQVSSSFVFLLTAGGRAQIKLWTLTPSGELSERASHMLRSEEDLLRDWRSCQALDDPEVRYMDLEILPSVSSSVLYVYTVASDGILRIFVVNHEEYSLKPLLETCVGNRCLLKVKCFTLSDFSVCLVGGTDGYITFFKHNHNSEEIVKLNKFKVHSGGVNALNVKLAGCKVLVVSGGDDSVLVMSLFSCCEGDLNNLMTLGLDSSESLPSLHTCQITGVEIKGDYVVSAGLEGNICLLQYTVIDTNIKIKHLSTIKSPLPDIHGVLTHLSSDTKLMNVGLHGVGLEILKFILFPD